MNRMIILLLALLFVLTTAACKTKPVIDEPHANCGFSNPFWSAPSFVDGDSIKLSVTSAKNEQQITISIYREGESEPLETVVLPPSLGKASIDWRYNCDKYHRNSIRSLPKVYFTAGYFGSPCRIKSASIRVGQRIYIENVDGRGIPEKNLKYKLIGTAESGEIIHVISGKTDATGLISREDLLPCVPYTVKFYP